MALPPPQFAASGQQAWGNANNIESTFQAQWYILSQPTVPSFAARGAFGTGFSHKDRSADKLTTSTHSQIRWPLSAEEKIPNVRSASGVGRTERRDSGSNRTTAGRAATDRTVTRHGLSTGPEVWS